MCSSGGEYGLSGQMNGSQCTLTLSKNCDSFNSVSTLNGFITMINPTKTQFTFANPPIPFIKMTCGNKTFDYNFTNSTAYFNPDKKQLEFTPIDNKDLGCQYGSGDNYLSFLCSTDNSSVTAVQYKCGL